jgi:hypothetical protein
VTAELTTPPVHRRVNLPRVGVLPVSLGVLVLGRLLEFGTAASPDEGGFLVVAGQWHAGGSSLYGSYWVDRPPLLLMLFQAADLFGGLPALRVLGILAAATTVVLLASTARRAFGRRAAAWTAVVAAALLVSPMYGAVDVNGELLAAPFIALGIRAAVETFETEDLFRSRVAALTAGAAAVAALLIKQNMADVVVFTAICWVVARHQRRLPFRDLADRVLLAGAGFVSGYAVEMLWAMAHGSSPGDIYQATYPFRITAARAIAATNTGATGERLGDLVHAFVWSGVPLLVLAFLVSGIRRSRQPAVVTALLGVLAFDVFSIAAGGSYWLHYLVQSVPAVALAAGAASLAAPRAIRAVTVAVAASALVATGTAAVHPTSRPGTTIGNAIADVAHPGDTLFSAFGDANILRSTGLSSPYPYLWSLPARGLDPDLAQLRGVLAGPTPPTWIVIRGRATDERLEAGGAQALIESRYRQVTTICGRTIHLLRSRHRAVPTTDGRCGPAVTLP